jgi:Cu2+-exporting ATPase
VGGAINIGSAIVMRVERVGEETVLAAIVRLMERAVGEKRPVVELADRAAHWFVLGIVIVAGLTAAVWSALDPDRALWIAVSVLVVTCPCALSLATPVALTVGTGALARRGFVVTRGHAIETLARTTDVVFDKTGTLTHGAPTVIDVVRLGGEALDAAIAVAGALEAASEHPLARAIAAFAAERGGQALPVAEVENLPGDGVQGVVGGRRYRIGRATFCREIAGAEAPADDGRERHTVVWLAGEGAWLARFVLDDVLRQGAAELIAELGRLGKRVHVLSGDQEGPVRAVAARLGIERLAAGMRPDAKRDYVARLQSRGALVAMVGDGINDAPVIAQADVSVAMASGATLAQARADAVLLSGEPADLARAFGKATETLRVIRQNLAWATGYNLVVIPAAVLGHVTPWMAGLAMSASSLLVVLNALRLRDRTQPKGRGLILAGRAE